MKKGITVVAFVAIASMSGAGVLSVDLVGSGPTNVNLTTEGTADWVMLGQGGGTRGITCRDEKAGVDYIGPVTVSGTHDSWFEHPSRFDWTNGSPTDIGNHVLGDWEAKPLYGLASTDQRLSFSVDGLAVGDYTMTLYTSSFKAGQQLTATMGESSMTASQVYAEASKITTYFVVFSIERMGDSLIISFNRNDSSDSQYSNVGISAITIKAVPKPKPLGLITSFGVALVCVHRVF